MNASTQSSGQVIPWCRRSDLQIVPLEFEGRPSWGIKDPMTLAYFELHEEEFHVLNQLDGRTTVDELIRRFHERFQPRTLSVTELQSFLEQLISQGLVAAKGPGYGRALVARDRLNQMRRRWSKWLSILTIRFRGIDPDPLLRTLLQWCGWLFTPWAFLLSLLLMGSALTLVVVHLDTLNSRLPDARAMLSTSNLVWLAILLAAVKVLHELGHGLTCKRFGGECRELGLMLLVFMPTLYCNVSDIWMVRDKWKRIAVSCAGMWVEATIASVCTFLWWFSAPGLFHSLCLNLMFLCGVSTFVFNGNPLLKYDGYFVLSDWLEIPNLQQQSLAAVRSKLVHWYCFPGASWSGGHSITREWMLICYGTVSAIYRLSLTAVILWSLYRWLQPMGLGLLVQMLAFTTIGLMVLTPITSVVRFLQSPETRARIDWLRFTMRLGATIAAAIILLNIPLPNGVVAGALLDRDEARPVYTTLPGTLETGVRIGQRVEAGQELAKLTLPDYEAERVRIEGEVRQHRIRLDHFEKRRISEPEAGQAIPAVREALHDFEQQLAQWTDASERLVLRAPVAGTVLPAPSQANPVPHGMLPSWSGTPLAPRNAGCFLRSGTMVCLVGSPDSRTALALINQDDINLVQLGQQVRMRWNELSGEVLKGRIIEIAALDLDLLSRDAMVRLQIPARQSPTGGLLPVGTWYQARIRLDETDAPLIRGSAGQARIVTEPQSLGTRFIRWLARTFPHHG